MNAVAEATQKLCWTALRSVMTGYSEFKLREFAAAHPDEVFYCLCVYFDGCYGDFFLYVNDPDQARQTAINIKEAYPSLYSHQTIQAVENQLKWNCGDFRFSFFNVDPLWEVLWRPVQTLYDQLGMQLFREIQESERLQWSDSFAETACLVALDLERSEILNLLKRTEDFRVICVDHDETMEDSNARLERVRKRYSALPRPGA